MAYLDLKPGHTYSEMLCSEVLSSGCDLMCMIMTPKRHFLGGNSMARAHGVVTPNMAGEISHEKNKMSHFSPGHLAGMMWLSRHFYLVLWIFHKPFPFYSYTPPLTDHLPLMFLPAWNMSLSSSNTFSLSGWRI